MIGNRMRTAKIIAKRRMSSISWIDRCTEEEKKKIRGTLRKNVIRTNNGSRHYEKGVGIPTIQEKKWEEKEKQMIEDLEEDIVESKPLPVTIWIDHGEEEFDVFGDKRNYEVEE